MRASLGGLPPYRCTAVPPLIGLLLFATPARLSAQYDQCRPGAGSNEAKTLAMFSLPLAFSPVAAPGGPHRFTLGLEASRVPSVDPATATPTVCRPGKGPENTDLLPALGRLRLGVPLPLGFALEGSWIPPVRVNGVKSDLFGLALARTVGEANSLALAVRAHATFGSVQAPVTCDADGLVDPSSECFHGMISDDRYSPNIMGLDASLGWSLAGGKIRPYAGSGYNRLQPRFQVNFTNQFGQTDRTVVEVNLNRVVVFGGAALQLTNKLNVTAEIYAAPADGASGRFVIRRALGS